MSVVFSQAADINVLQIVPLTGVQGGVGWQMKVGAQVAFDAINAKGGIQGRKLNLATFNEDDAGAVDRLRRRIESDGAVALLSMVGSGAFDAMWRAQLPQSLRLPVVGVQSGAHSVHRLKDPLVALTRASASDEIDQVFQHLATVHMRRVAYVGDDDDDGRALLQAAREKAARFGVELVAAALHTPHTADVAGAAASILKTTHHAVVIASNTAAVALFSKLYRKSQGSGQIVALSSAEATQLALVVGSDVARGVMISQVVPNPRNPRVALMREFLADYMRHGPAELEPTLTMTEAYINARLLAHAVQAGGADAGRSAVARFLATHDSVELSGFRVVLRPEGGSHLTSMSVIDGRGRVLY
jgi:branched-chain amino acid transport system substrate-binding protein